MEVMDDESSNPSWKRNTYDSGGGCSRSTSLACRSSGSQGSNPYPLSSCSSSAPPPLQVDKDTQDPNHRPHNEVAVDLKPVRRPPIRKHRLHDSCPARFVPIHAVFALLLFGPCQNVEDGFHFASRALAGGLALLILGVLRNRALFVMVEEFPSLVCPVPCPVVDLLYFTDLKFQEPGDLVSIRDDVLGGF